MRTARLTPLLLLSLVACGGGGDTKTDDDRRTVTISATDALKFEPATIASKVGEDIHFVITNTGSTDHEFVIGDDDYQGQHGSGDDGGHGGHGDDGGVAVDVPAGKTVSIDFTMPAQPPTYACHVSNHDDAGMKGTVTYG